MPEFLHYKEMHAAVDELGLAWVLGKGQKQRAVKVSQDLIERVRQTYQGRHYLFETFGGKRLSAYNSAARIRHGGDQRRVGHSSVPQLRCVQDAPSWQHVAEQWTEEDV